MTEHRTKEQESAASEIERLTRALTIETARADAAFVQLDKALSGDSSPVETTQPTTDVVQQLRDWYEEEWINGNRLTHERAMLLWSALRALAPRETTQLTTACRHDWVSNIGGIRCVSCGAQIAGRCLPEEPSEMSELQRLQNGIRALQLTCCGESNDLCHGCRTLLALLKSPEETIARPPNYNAFHAFEKRLEAAVRPEEPTQALDVVRGTMDGYGCTGCRSTPCICSQLEPARELSASEAASFEEAFANSPRRHEPAPEKAPAPVCGVTSVLDTKCELPYGHGGRHKFGKSRT